jgi:hypothetical protein
MIKGGRMKDNLTLGERNNKGERKHDKFQRKGIN